MPHEHQQRPAVPGSPLAVPPRPSTAASVLFRMLNLRSAPGTPVASAPLPPPQLPQPPPTPLRGAPRTGGFLPALRGGASADPPEPTPGAAVLLPPNVGLLLDYDEDDNSSAAVAFTGRNPLQPTRFHPH